MATEEKATIVRIRGIARVHQTVGSAVGAGFKGALGIGIVTAQAFAAGVTSIPGPITDSFWDGWMWHSFFDVRVVTATIADGANAASVSYVVPIDSKAMRKWDGSSENVLVGVMELIEQTTAVMELEADTRVLIKLS